MRKIKFSFKLAYVQMMCFLGNFAKSKPTPETLEEALSAGKVWILYRKVCGEVSEYVSTRNMALIPKEDQPTGNGKRKENQLPHYNLKEGNEGWKAISYLKGKVLDWQFIG